MAASICRWHAVDVCSPTKGPIMFTTVRSWAPPIFESDEAKQVFLELVLSVAARFAWQVHAYAIMTNHFHLLVTTPLGNLSQGMHALQSAFANKHKVFRGSIGHVFQSRFGSDHYPIGPLAGSKLDYVHLNPVRAGIITLDELIN